jgi:murein DD-endopeptidase MepM/ murein hydrolase activator NlpD
MEWDENIKSVSFAERLKRKYRLIIFSDSDFEPIFKVHYSKWFFHFSWIGTVVFFIATIFSIIAFTPVRVLIPGYPSNSLKESLISNAQLVDSLEFELQRRDQYFANMQNIVLGKEPVNLSLAGDSMNKDEDYSVLNFEEAAHSEGLSGDESNNIFVINNDKKLNSSISSLHFFTPVKGIVTNKFKSQNNHFGTDIVASSEEVVKAILPGTVILASWTLKTGHVIQLQHDNNLISLYKHNAELLKKEGQYVDAGEPIAIIGNSGELTTGPHLHFELWHNMVPINPEDYIRF